MITILIKLKISKYIKHPQNTEVYTWLRFNSTCLYSLIYYFLEVSKQTPVGQPSLEKKRGTHAVTVLNYVLVTATRSRKPFDLLVNRIFTRILGDNVRNIKMSSTVAISPSFPGFDVV